MPLIHLVNKASSSSSSEGRKLGGLVRRLDIILPHSQLEGQNPEDTVAAIVQDIIQLLRLLPKLKTLLVRNTLPRQDQDHTQNAMIETGFFDAIPSELEELVWIEDSWRFGLRVPESAWTDFLQTHPCLKMISWPAVDIPKEMFWDEPQSGLLTSPMSRVTHTVMRLGPIFIRPEIYLLPTAQQQDVLPNLRHVLFEIPWIGPYGLDMMQGVLPLPTMLELHGRKITSLDCIYERTLSKVSVQHQYFTMIATHCPNIKELGIFLNWRHRVYRGTWAVSGEPYEDAAWQFDLPAQMPSVKRLRVRRMYRRYDEGAYREMLRFVRVATIGEGRKLPNCLEVQLESERDVMYLLRHRDSFQVDFGILEKHGLTMLDHRGLPLTTRGRSESR